MSSLGALSRGGRREAGAPFGAGFLATPDLFPSRHAGEPWGDAALHLEVAGCAVDVRGLAGSQLEALGERYHALRARTRGTAEAGPVDPAAIHFALCRSDLRDFREFDRVGREVEYDIDPGERRLRIAGWRTMALVDLADDGAPAAATLWLPEDSEDELLGTFENVFRIVLAYALLERGGLLLHSAGVLHDGGAAVFFGRSGAGKTTVTRWAVERGLAPLSDDLNALVPAREASDARYEVQQLPFAGDLGGLGAAERHPLSGLYRLQQAPRHALRDLSASTAVAELAACAPFVNFDPHRGDRLLEVATAIVGAIRPQTLEFARDPGFWPLVLGDGAGVEERGVTGDAPS